MILIGQYDSPFVRRVAVTLNIYQIEYERKVLSVFTDFEEILKINPVGKVPVLQLSTGEYLFDSRMILEYLESIAPESQRLGSPDPAIRNNCLRVEAVALGLAEKCYERGIEFARRDPDKVDVVWAERLKAQIISALNWLDSYRANPWLVGESISQADITCAVAYTFLLKKLQIEVNRGTYKILDAHNEYCEELPEFKQSPYSVDEALRSGWKKHSEHTV